MFERNKRWSITRTLFDRLSEIKSKNTIRLIQDLIIMIPVEKDYLQIFDFSTKEIKGVTYQVIVHHQEVPNYKKKLEYPVKKEDGFTGKIYAIDDEEHCTILFASER